MTQKLKGLGDILSDSFRLFGENASRILFIGLYLYVPTGVCVLFFTARNGLLDERQIYNAKNVPPTIFLDGLIMTLLSVTVYLIYQTVFFRIVQSADKKEIISLKDCFKDFFPKARSLVLIFVLVVARIAFWSLLLIIPSFFLSLGVKSAIASAFSILLFLGGALVGTLLSAFYSLSNYILLADGKKGREALRLSRKYVTANFWSYVGYAMVLIIITSLTGMFVQTILQFVFGRLSQDNIGFMPMTGFVLGYILQGIISIYGFIYFFNLYKEFKYRCEPAT